MAQASSKKLIQGWRIQTRVIHALMIRELITRYGRENIGFLWIMVEPLLFALLVASIWRVWKGPLEHGLGIVAIVVSGYIPLVFFRQAVTRSSMIFTANGSLIYHRQIKMLDFILVRFIIELLGGMLAYFFVACFLISLDAFPVPADIGMLIAGWSVYALFTLSLCLIIAPLSELSDTVEKLIPIVTYIMIPFSGAFTLQSWLAPTAREFMMWSPFVNGMEMMRAGIWGSEVTTYYNVWNPLICATIFTGIGLIMCRRVRKNLSVE